jgi:DNA-binding NtrC family response regulator
MTQKTRLDGKKVAMVDDEPDVLDALEELLPMCHIRKARSFEEAKRLLKGDPFDIAILDIMGVQGYDLLKIANEKKIITVMLTAHAFSLESTIKSFNAGADLYVPKDKIGDIVIFLEDVLEAKEKGKSTWWRWLERLGSHYDEVFEKDWRYKNKEFWKKFPYA